MPRPSTTLRQREDSAQTPYSPRAPGVAPGLIPRNRGRAGSAASEPRRRPSAPCRSERSRSRCPGGRDPPPASARRLAALRPSGRPPGALPARPGRFAHERFGDHLRRTQPSKASFGLLRKALIRQWNQVEAERDSHSAAARQALETIRQRRDRLIDAYVYKEAMPEADYRERLAVLDREILEAEERLSQTEAPALGDLQGLLRLRRAPRHSPGGVVARVHARPPAPVPTSAVSGWNLVRRRQRILEPAKPACFSAVFRRRTVGERGW